jgi:hypothetical protein
MSSTLFWNLLHNDDCDNDSDDDDDDDDDDEDDCYTV